MHTRSYLKTETNISKSKTQLVRCPGPSPASPGTPRAAGYWTWLLGLLGAGRCQRKAVSSVCGGMGTPSPKTKELGVRFVRKCWPGLGTPAPSSSHLLRDLGWVLPLNLQSSGRRGRNPGVPGLKTRGHRWERPRLPRHSQAACSPGSGVLGPQPGN